MVPSVMYDPEAENAGFTALVLVALAPPPVPVPELTLSAATALLPSLEA